MHESSINFLLRRTIFDTIFNWILRYCLPKHIIIINNIITINIIIVVVVVAVAVAVVVVVVVAVLLLLLEISNIKFKNGRKKSGLILTS